jgi:hypothetical protein
MVLFYSIDFFFCEIQVLVAHRYGIKRVISPERNLKDLTEVPSLILSGMEVCGCMVVCLRLLRRRVCCSSTNARRIGATSTKLCQCIFLILYIV